MDKVNEFEHGIDTITKTRFDSLYFGTIANEQFRYVSSDELLNTANGKKAFRDMIDTFFSSQKKRLKVLSSYAKGDNYSILNGHRRLDNEKADYRVRHKWGGYISSFATSYVIGNPVTVGILEGTDEEQLKTIQEIEWNNDINALNGDLALDASIYGRAFEYHFRDKDGADRVVSISPLEMFVVRDLTVEQNIICAVHLPVFADKVNMTVYTKDQVITFKPYSANSVRLIVDKTTKHEYKDVPVVEWWNNRYRMGDFESEIPLIDAYDAGQSDTANYMSDLNDAMLVIKGDLDAIGASADSVAKMKDANTLLLQTGISANGQQTSADAGYNATSSGIALLYKMIGLEQVRKDKETFFTKALRRRYELISNIHKAINKPLIEANKLTFTFHPNIPQDVWNEIKAYIEAGGVVSQETLMNNASFTDYKTEQSRILKEQGASDNEIMQLVGGMNEQES